MSITAAKLQVVVDADSSSAEQKLNSFSRALSGFATGAMMGVGMAAANAIGNAMRGAVAGMGDAVTAASDLGETVNMMTVIMGDASAATLKWSQSSATALGMSQNQALRAAGTFAAFGKATGLAGEDLTQFSTGLVSLATDLGSLYNTSPEQAITAIGAALRGESEPIRAYNILLDEATLRQAALTLGIVDTIKTALTPQQRVLAAEAELWRQSADARGDFANTSGNLAGQQKILTANMTELSTVMGTAFLPVMLQTTTALNTGLGVAMPYLASVMNAVLVPALNTGITGLTNFIGAQLGISTAFDGSEESVRAFTATLISSINSQIEGVNAGIAALETMIQRTEEYFQWLSTEWAREIAPAQDYFSWLSAEWARETSAMGAYFGEVRAGFEVDAGKIGAAFDKVGSAVGTLGGSITALAGGAHINMVAMAADADVLSGKYLALADAMGTSARQLSILKG